MTSAALFGQEKGAEFKMDMVGGTMYERQLMMLLGKYATQHAATLVGRLEGPLGHIGHSSVYSTALDIPTPSTPSRY